MKHNNKKQTGCLSARAAALRANFFHCTSAWAENKVVIDNINILPGGEAVVNVDLQNEDKIMDKITDKIICGCGGTAYTTDSIVWVKAIHAGSLNWKRLRK